jgi:hypothetical protein
MVEHDVGSHLQKSNRDTVVTCFNNDGFDHLCSLGYALILPSLFDGNV